MCRKPAPADYSGKVNSRKESSEGDLGALTRRGKGVTHI